MDGRLGLVLDAEESVAESRNVVAADEVHILAGVREVGNGRNL